MKWWSTQIFERDELITGSIIRLNAGSKYRPEGWVDMQKNSTRPDVITASGSDSLIVVDDAWWGSYNYRAFNVGKENGVTFTAAEYTALENDHSKLGLRIYIPIVKRAELTAEDRTYLTSLGLDPDSYRVLDFEYFVDSHYNSSQKGVIITQSSGSVKYKFVAAEVFSKYDLTLGTVIRITGDNHNYRPDGWVNYSEKYSGTRPVAVSLSPVTVDNAWWGGFRYRGFNIQKLGANESNPVTEADASAIRIYVKID